MNEKEPGFVSMPGHLIRRCHQIAVALLLEECSQFNITPVQYGLLSALKAFPKIEQNQLPGIIAIDRSTIGSVASRLEERGLIQRRNDQIDRRRKKLSLTRAGEEFLEEVTEKVEKAQRSILAPLNKKERVEFVRLMSKMSDMNNFASRAPLKGARSKKSQ